MSDRIEKRHEDISPSSRSALKVVAQEVRPAQKLSYGDPLNKQPDCRSTDRPHVSPVQANFGIRALFTLIHLFKHPVLLPRRSLRVD